MLYVKLANSPNDINTIKNLRYYCGFSESEDLALDEFDYFSDHLMVYYEEDLVGSVRLLRKEIADKNLGLLSSKCFNTKPLFDKLSNKNILEVDWICTSPDFRDKRVIEYIYNGMLSYIKHYQITAVIGRACFYTTDVSSIESQLNYIFNNMNVQEEFDIKALPKHEVKLERRELGALETKRAIFSLPPAIKGYLNFGTKFCTSAVIEEDLGTIDILGIVTDETDFDPRYVRHFWKHGYDTKIPVDLFNKNSYDKISQEKNYESSSS
jgi:putative hemolysin